jgi:hypothetical protein
MSATFRDCDGELIAAATWNIPGADDPTLAEAYVMYLAMTMVVECCFQDIEFESDNDGVVTLINSVDCNPKSYLGNIVWGIKCIKSQFRSCFVRHISRQANRASHCMALLAQMSPTRFGLRKLLPNL